MPLHKCAACANTRHTIAPRSGGAIYVCAQCDQAACPKCAAPVPGTVIACPACAAIVGAHDPRTRQEGGV